MTSTDLINTEFAYSHHTFLLRKAPYRSERWSDGVVYAELRVPSFTVGPHGIACRQLANLPLREMGIDHEVVERWIHPYKGWKLLRFTVANPFDLLRLHEVCANPDIQGRDEETMQWLAAIAAESFGVRELRDLAVKVGIPKARRMNKAQLIAAFGIAPAAQVATAPAAAEALAA